MTEEVNCSAGPDVRQMGGACTSAQLRNITLCSQLNEVHRSLMNLLPRLPVQATANLRCAASVYDMILSAASCVVQCRFAVRPASKTLSWLQSSIERKL